MKITVNVDCTPEEARAFLGLPDVRPLQDELMDEVRERVMASLRSMEPDEMMRLWMPGAVKGLEQWQEMLRQMTGGSPRRE
jgi:hypothetical protein